MKIDGLSDKRIDTERHGSLPKDKRTISVMVDLTMHEDLARIANEENVRMSDLLRFIFDDFIKKYDE